MPQAILLQDHEQLGQRGAVVDVSKGYLRNYLIPRKLAEPATKGAIAAAERRRDSAQRAAAQATQRAQDSAAVLSRTGPSSGSIVASRPRSRSATQHR